MGEPTITGGIGRFCPLRSCAVIRHVAIRFTVAAVALAGVTAIAPGADDAPSEEVAKLVAHLASDDFETREKAAPALITLGEAALAEVEKAALTRESETRFRALTVLA